eukprot:gene11554-18937_t
MTKAAVRAMDTITSFTTQLDPSAAVARYAVAGASKRGWTTWLTAAVDDRVIAAVPIVMDMLNFAVNLPHMYRAYGNWTFAFKDYWELNLTARIGSPEFDRLAAAIDPLTYRARLSTRKLVIDSTGDEFFMPDDDHY